MQNISEISTMLFLNYREKKIWTKIKSRMDRKKTKGIANADRKNLSGQFFCPDIFFVRTIFLSTIYLSGQFFGPDIFFVRTKGHSPPSRILTFSENL
jgi:hypothetical protein